MRVSEKSRYDLTNARVERAKQDNANMLEAVSSQKKINRVSDAPIDLSHAIKLTNKVSREEQYGKSISYAKGFLERSESTVSGISENLIRVKELAVGMANSTYGPDSRKAVAREVREIIDGTIAQGNAMYGNRYMFSGFRVLTPPLTADGTYVGDDGCIFLPIDENRFKQINVKARELFDVTSEERQQGHTGMIQALKVLHDGLMEDDQDTIHQMLEEVDFQLEKSTNYMASLGAISRSLEDTDKRVELSKELNTKILTGIEDVDMYRASSDFKRTETVLQSTLLASNKLLQPSLMNFLQ